MVVVVGWLVHWVAITKCHALGGLNNKHLFSQVLAAGKSKVKVHAYSVPGEDPFLGVQTTAFFMSSHGGERGLVSSSSYRDTNPIVGPLPS